MNNNTGYAQTFSYEDTPNVIVSDAMRISMSIPIIFIPHKVYCKNMDGERVLDKKFKDDYFIDGGLTENYPLSLFDKTKYLSSEMQKKLGSDNIQGKIANPETLGFRLVDKEQKNYFEGKTLQPKNNHTNFFSNIVSAALNKKDSDHIRSEENSRTVYIDNCGIDTLDFDLNDPQKENLIKSGRISTKDYFEFVPANQQNPSLIDLIKNSQKESTQINNLKNFSTLNKEIEINSERCVLGLCYDIIEENKGFFSHNKKISLRNPILVLEKINNNGEVTISYYNLLITKRNPYEGLTLINKIKTNDADYEKRMSLLQNNILKSNKKYNKSWIITHDQAKLFQQLIANEEQRSECFNFEEQLGDEKLTCQEIVDRNCFSWIRKSLINLGKQTNDIRFENDLISQQDFLNRFKQINNSNNSDTKFFEEYLDKKLTEKLRNNRILIRVWTSDNDIHNKGLAKGHISLELVGKNKYLSMLRKHNSNTTENKLDYNKSYEEDVDSLYRKPNFTFCFHTLDAEAILLDLINVADTKDQHSVSYIWSLLQRGGINNILSTKDRAITTFGESTQGSLNAAKGSAVISKPILEVVKTPLEAIYPNPMFKIACNAITTGVNKLEKSTEKDIKDHPLNAISEGVTYSTEQLISPVTMTVDAILPQLTLAQDNELKHYPLVKKINESLEKEQNVVPRLKMGASK